MSNLVVPNLSKVYLTKQAALPAQNFYPATIKLFQNNYIPVAGTVIGDLTEATFSGYAAQALAGGAVSGMLDASGRAVAQWNAVTFTKAGATGNTIYGYYVIDGSGNLLWAERFDSSIAMNTDGAFIQLTPKFTGMSQFSNT